MFSLLCAYLSYIISQQSSKVALKCSLNWEYFSQKVLLAENAFEHKHMLENKEKNEHKNLQWFVKCAHIHKVACFYTI